MQVSFLWYFSNTGCSAGNMSAEDACGLNQMILQVPVFRETTTHTKRIFQHKYNRLSDSVQNITEMSILLGSSGHFCYVNDITLPLFNAIFKQNTLGISPGKLTLVGPRN